MPSILKLGIVAGLLAGILVGGYQVLFTVPVIEEAIAFEEAAALQQAAGEAESGGEVVSLGAQKIGAVVGMVIFGVVLGAIFSGIYALVRNIVPGWRAITVALVSAGIGFWALSLFPFLKYPLNPPGVGETDTLVFRQGFQFLFFALSMGSVVALLVLLNRINRSAESPAKKQRNFAQLGLLYGAFAIVLYFVLPSNPDPVTAPSDIVWRFRVLSLVGHLLLWGLLAVGVAVLLSRSRRSFRPVT